jgi:hypothetical protein
MSFFAPQTEVLDLGNGNTVQLRKLTYAEMSSIYDDPETEERRGLLITQKALHNWTGPDFDGRPATYENMMALPARITLDVIQFAVKINTLSTEEGEASGVATS